MKQNILFEFIKILIDAFIYPFKKNKTILSYLLNNTFRQELEEKIEKGEVFPLQHIHRSIRLAKKFSNQNFIILDIGGGIGASVKLYNKLFSENRIIVFEPVLENYNTIKSTFEGFSNIEVCNVAVGNENSKREINIANRITSSSLLPLAADTDSNFYNEKYLGHNRIENIEIVRLDDFLDKSQTEIGIMKIDVQGYEMNVLRGAELTLKKTNIVLLEVTNHDVYAGSPKYFDIDLYLRDHDFTLYDIIPSVLDKGRIKEWDCLYISKSALCALVY